jgi:hypothetical protein
MSVIRVIDVKKQQKLTLRKSFRLVLSGIRHRLLRSGLTMSVILLAVAFFMAMISESALVGSVARGVRGELSELHEAAAFLSLLRGSPSSLGLCQQLAGIVRDGGGAGDRKSVV